MWSRRDRDELARVGGSCERMYEPIFNDDMVDLVTGTEAGEVRIEGGIALPASTSTSRAKSRRRRRWPSSSAAAAGTARTHADATIP